MAKGFIVVTPEFRAAFTNLFEPKAFVQNGKARGEPKYSFTALFPISTDLTSVKQTAMAAAQAKWPGLADIGKVVRFPFKNGDKEAERLLAKGGKTEDQVKFYRGNIVLKASTEYKPQVVDRAGNDILKPGDVYSGCYGYAELNFVANEISEGGETKRYVSAYFNFFMKSRDGERLAGRDAKTVFKGLLGGESNTDPSAGDDIPF